MYDYDRISNIKALVGFILVLVITTVIGSIYLFKTDQDYKNNPRHITPFIYEITKKGSNNKIYLFGSMHMVDLEEFDFPDQVMDAYNKSHYLACEFDMDNYNNNADTVEEAQKLIYTDGTKLQNHISKDLYDKIVKYFKDKNMYSEALDLMVPYAIEATISQELAKDAGLKGDGIDEYFLKKAKADNKKILEVESYEFQSELSLSFSDKVYEISIAEVLDNYDESITEMKELYKAWKKGDTKALLKYSTMNDSNDSDKKYTEEEINLMKDYNKKMFDDRNVPMAEKLVEYFEKGQDVFFMVGAGHLVGDKGIASLVKAKGYNVVQVSY